MEKDTEENTSLSENGTQTLNISLKKFRRSLTNRMNQANDRKLRHKVRDHDNLKKRKNLEKTTSQDKNIQKMWYTFNTKSSNYRHRKRKRVYKSDTGFVKVCV